ncbi:hypothetical protein OQA88_2288 [Cercophora sp. LCS_1]
MQSSRYSVYNDFYKANLEYVYAQCGGAGPTDIPPRLEVAAYTTKDGDTCDSVASASKVSAAALYITNQDVIRECQKIPAGLSLCLPPQCTTYRLRPEDICISIETAHGIAIDSLSAYNPWINADCSNLHAAPDWYGKLICVSPPGGQHNDAAGPPAQASPGLDPIPGGPGSGTSPGGSGGYSRSPTPPPSGAPLATAVTKAVLRFGNGQADVIFTG